MHGGCTLVDVSLSVPPVDVGLFLERWDKERVHHQSFSARSVEATVTDKFHVKINESVVEPPIFTFQLFVYLARDYCLFVDSKDALVVLEMTGNSRVTFR